MRLVDPPGFTLARLPDAFARPRTIAVRRMIARDGWGKECPEFMGQAHRSCAPKVPLKMMVFAPAQPSHIATVWHRSVGQHGTIGGTGVLPRNRLFYVDDAALDSAEHRLRAIGDPELVENVRHVSFHRRFRQMQCGADFFIAHPFSDQEENL
jgi:hypothetical protein